MRSTRLLGIVGAAVCVLVGLGSSQPPQDQTPPPAPPPAPTGAPAGEELREAVVQLRDGQRYTGLLVSRDDENVVLKIAGIETKIPAAQVARVTVMAPILERYKSMREAIDDNDSERLLLLAEWLRARAQWDPALNELDHILKLQPDNVQAKKLKTLVSEQKRLAERAGSPKAPRPPGNPTPPKPEEPEFPLLAERDINLIKVYETDLDDRPRLIISREVITQLMEEHLGDPLIPPTLEGREAMYRLDPARILEIMFKVRARNLYGKVRVQDNPRSMLRFRDDVQRAWLINSCATSRCHGGPDGGRLQLCAKRSGTEGAVYTNFLILDRFRMADGRPLINYDEPSKSPLLHMALPREDALYKHPEVRGAEGRGDLWHAVFRSEDDKRFQDAVAWINLLYRPRPEYPVQYTPPGASAPPAKAQEPPVER